MLTIDKDNSLVESDADLRRTSNLVVLTAVNLCFNLRENEVHQNTQDIAVEHFSNHFFFRVLTQPRARRLTFLLPIIGREWLLSTLLTRTVYG